MVDVAPGLFAGLLLGMSHAVEPDHLAAISTLVTEDRRSPGAGRRSNRAPRSSFTVTLLYSHSWLLTPEFCILYSVS